MPYSIKKRGDKWLVEGPKGVVPGGDHPTYAKALAHQRALMVNVPDAAKKCMVKDTGAAMPNAAMLAGPGGMANTPGLGEKRKKVKGVNRFHVKAVMSTASANNLPDSAFLYISPGGSKDGEGKTVPRSLRHFPYRNASGGIDLPHLRNAIARIPQASIPAEKKASLQAHARKLLEDANKSKELTPGFLVFKQDDGSYRWIAISSNAYRDREKEIVAYKALNEDCDYADATGEYGPLRWWHLGDLHTGVDIGDCDFNCMVGRMLVESGSFKTKEIGETIQATAPDYEMSIAFLPTTEADADGTYWKVRRVERSLIPKDKGLAANPFTALAVTKESSDMADVQEKWKDFVAKLFKGDETKAKAFVQTVETKDQQIAASGVKFKEGTKVKEGTNPKGAEKIEDVGENTAGAEVEKAHDEVPEANEESPEGEAAEETMNVSDMTVAELEQMFKELADYIIESCNSHTGSMVAESMKGYHENMGRLMESAMAPRTKELKDQAATVAKLDARVKALEGEQPVAGKNRFRASTATETVTQDPKLKEQAPVVAGAGMDELTRKMIENLFTPGTLPHQ